MSKRNGLHKPYPTDEAWNDLWQKVHVLLKETIVSLFGAKSLPLQTHAEELLLETIFHMRYNAGLKADQVKGVHKLLENVLTPILNRGGKPG